MTRSKFISIASIVIIIATILPLARVRVYSDNNVLVNPGFESGTSPWNFYTNGEGSFTTVSPGSGSTKAAMIAITAPGTNVQLYQRNVPLVAGSSYRLSFDAYSNSGHDVEVILHKDTSPYTNYGLKKTFGITNSWSTYSVEFDTQGFSGTVNDGRLRFWLAPFDAAGDKYYIDNVVLQKLDGTTPPPPPPPSPPPSTGGLIYKEYSRLMTGPSDWRVTDPNAGHPGASEWLPNPKLSFQISDLSGATKAEAIIDCWGGHTGTTNKRFRFNGNSWINIPELSTMSSPECYLKQWNPIVPVPLSYLKQGTNILEGTSGGQICYNFDWGQWGWYAMVLRVYFGDSKPHPTGYITSPTSGSTIGENPVIKVYASSTAGIKRVEVLAYYEDYDSDGNGIYKQYQGSYRRINIGGTYQLAFTNHVGTDTTAPYEITWDTTWVPDQAPGSIKLKARILDNNGVWYETEEVTGITLKRSGSVKLYKPFAVPQNFHVRIGETKSSKVNIPSLSGAISAKLLIATWNGKAGGDPHYMKVNSWTAPDYGKDHLYSYDELNLPISALKTGDNKIEFWSSTEHHGIEVLWPGPGIKVRYSK